MDVGDDGLDLVDFCRNCGGGVHWVVFRDDAGVMHGWWSHDRTPRDGHSATAPVPDIDGEK